MKNIFRSKGVWLSVVVVMLAVYVTMRQGNAEPAAPQTVTPPASVLSLQDSFASIARTLKPSVVSITTQQVIRYETPQHEYYFGDPFEFFFDDFFGQQPQRRRPSRPRTYEQRAEGSGSGVVINEKGYVLTNHHVIANAEKIRVHFGTDEKESYEAEIIGKDPYTDLAVLKIKSNKKFVPVAMGNSDTLNVGDWVVAIGSPFGLEQTVTAGIVSAKRQSMVIEGKRYEDFIQTDAAINRGNSGGPLVNIRGELVGINTAIYAPTGVFSGIGFAIPVNKAKDIIGGLIKDGKVVRGWLGVEIKEVDETIAKQFELKEKSGALVNRVMPDSPAQEGGIKRGDVIVAVNGDAVTSIDQLQRLVKKTEPGKKASFTVVRDGKKIDLKIKVGTMPDEDTAAPVSRGSQDNTDSASWKGYTVRSVNSAFAEKYGIPDGEKGVVVTDIEQSKDAVDMGLMEGDLIKGINRATIASVEDFKRAAKKADLAEGVVFDVIRQGMPIYVTFHLPE